MVESIRANVSAGHAPYLNLNTVTRTIAVMNAAIKTNLTTVDPDSSMKKREYVCIEISRADRVWLAPPMIRARTYDRCVNRN